MQLKRGETAYVIQESIIDASTYESPLLVTDHWSASMEGYEEKTDGIVSMSRPGNTPGKALENLLAAMKEAGIRT